MTAHETMLRELARLQAENRQLRNRAKWLRTSRDRWRAEAQAWKWGALTNLANGRRTTR